MKIIIQMFIITLLCASCQTAPAPKAGDQDQMSSQTALDPKTEDLNQSVHISSEWVQYSPEALKELGFTDEDAWVTTTTGVERDEDLTSKIDRIIKVTSKIVPGMTRRDLLEAYTGEGGLSNRTWRRYAYSTCPYIKVDVKFRPVGEAEDMFKERPEDIITEISKPFLEYCVSD